MAKDLLKSLDKHKENDETEQIAQETSIVLEKEKKFTARWLFNLSILTLSLAFIGLLQ